MNLKTGRASGYAACPQVAPMANLSFKPRPSDYNYNFPKQKLIFEMYDENKFASYNELRYGATAQQYLQFPGKTNSYQSSYITTQRQPSSKRADYSHYGRENTLERAPVMHH